MANYAQMNPGKYHLGYRFPTPVLIEKLPMHAEDEYRVELKYKHAVIVNRTAYVGNVQAFSRRKGSIKVESDAMYKSVVNEFDTFASYNKIEAAVNDGEEITGLAEFADKILQFKQNTLYVINVSRQIEVLESTHKHKGVSNPAAICKTDYGIAWANQHGCYLYDGKKVVDLLEKGGIQRINELTWSTFIGAPMVGYFPLKRQIIVVDDIAAAKDGVCYIYDMVTASWTNATSATFADAVKSNFITDWNGDLVHATSITPKKWSDTSAVSSVVDFQTKDIDFGHPSVRKKIYKVYISYKGDGRNVQVEYGVDGIAPSSNFYLISSDGSTTGGSAAAKCLNFSGADGSSPGTNDWLKAELKPSASINNINSFRLKISGDASSNNIAADFEINDISIIYRIKSVK
tara:strand:- start:2264 stop:3472 length:1209 start_codon:yes stop_codon:yes gene_type:complete